MAEYINICPRCGSTELTPTQLVRGSLTLVGVLPGSNNYTCERCGYEGFCPEVEIDKIDEFRRALKKE